MLMTKQLETEYECLDMYMRIETIQICCNSNGYIGYQGDAD